MAPDSIVSCMFTTGGNPSPNAPSLNDLLGTIALSILAGHRRYAHVTALRGDTVNPQGLGMSRVLSEDAVRRAFAEEAAGPLENWQREHLWRSVEPVLKAPWICDIDVTVKTIYGRQEGAEVGYNPHKPGRPAHAYHTFFISRLRLALDVVVAPGKQFHSRAVSQKFWEWWERLSAQHRPYLLRGDCGFGNENFMVECERLNRQQRYLFRLRLSRGGVRLIEKLSGQGGWKDCGQGWHGMEDQLRLQGWSCPRRVSPSSSVLKNCRCRLPLTGGNSTMKQSIPLFFVFVVFSCIILSVAMTDYA